MGLFHCFGNKLEEICVSLRWQLNVGAVSLEVFHTEFLDFH